MLAATPTSSYCNMKMMRKCVVTKLSPHWTVVCQHLGYSPADFRQGNDKKNLIAVLEHWIGAGERKGKPRTWLMFAEALNNINPSMSGEICDSLRSEGIPVGEL